MIKVSALHANALVLRRFAVWSFTLVALYFASPVVADPFNGFAITADPPCAGVETPANSSAWRYVQSIRANPAQAPRNEDIVAHTQSTLESAAASGDSWSLYTLGTYVYQYLATSATRTPAERARNKELAAAALEKSANAGNCEGALAMWRARVYRVPLLLQQAQRSVAGSDNAAAIDDVRVAQSTLTEARQWRQKALDLGLAAGGGAAALIQSSSNTMDTYQSQVAALQQRFDENDRVAKDRAQLQLDHQAQAAADARQEQEAIQRFRDAMTVRSASPSDATVILLYRATVAGLPQKWAEVYGGNGMSSGMSTFGALIGTFMKRDYSFGDDDIITVTKHGWYEDVYIVYLNIRRHGDDTSIGKKLRITNQGGYWSGELVEGNY